MIWLYILELIGMILTAWIIFLLVKELRQSVKESNEGKVSDKYDLD